MNEHIISYCINNYIKSDSNPLFAVLIKGKWGCGKTYLVNKILTSAYGKEWGKKALWLSVYGLSNREQVNQKLHELQYPLLANKYVKFLLAAGKSIVKIQTGSDINQNGVNDIHFDISVPDIKAEDTEFKAKKLLIIDDIERCSIPPTELLGFFADSILDKGLKIIFIGNIEEIHNKTDEQKSEFDRIKEKIIGIEFEVERDIDSALENFICELSLHEYSDQILQKTKKVLTILEYSNLRSVRQALFHIKEIINILCKTTKKINEQYVTDLIECFLVVFFQKCTGDITKENVSVATYAYIIKQTTFAKFDTEQKSKILGKVDFDSTDYFSTKFLIDSSIPLKEQIADIIFEGKFEIEKILDDYNSKTAPENEKTPLQKLQQGWWEYSDTEFKAIYSELEQGITNNYILNPHEIIQYTKLSLNLATEQIIPGNFELIKTKILNYIDINKDAIIKEDNFMYDDIYMLGVSTEQNKVEVLKIIGKTLRENNNMFHQKNIESSLSNFSIRNTSDFNNIINAIEQHNKHLDFSILANVNISKFHENIKNLSFSQHRALYQAFEIRYGKNLSNQNLKREYKPDIAQINKLSELFKQDSQNVLLSPENRRKQLYSQWYDELHKWMEENPQSS